MYTIRSILQSIKIFLKFNQKIGESNKLSGLQIIMILHCMEVTSSI